MRRPDVGWRQGKNQRSGYRQEQYLAEENEHQDEGQHEQAIEPRRRDLADDGAADVDGLVFVAPGNTQMLVITAAPGGDVQGDRRRRTVQAKVQVQVHAAESRHEQRGAEEREDP